MRNLLARTQSGGEVMLTPEEIIRDSYENIQHLRVRFEEHSWSRQQTVYDSKFIADFNHRLLNMCNQIYGLTQAQLKSQDCPECDGTGKKRHKEFTGLYGDAYQYPCPTCQGTGKKPRLDREKIAADILKVWFPNDEYKELDGSELILINMKCFAVADYVIALLPDEEEIRKAERETIYKNLCLRCQGVLDGTVKP